MQVYKTEKKSYLTNELKSWLLTMVIALILFLVFKLFFSLSEDKILLGIVVLFLLKLGDTFTQYHVTEIRLDANSNQITFILNNIMSGEKNKNYNLQQTHSEIIKTSKLNTFLNSDLILKIYLPDKKFFKIGSRYGFSPSTLETIDSSLKKLKSF